MSYYYEGYDYGINSGDEQPANEVRITSDGEARVTSDGETRVVD